MSLIKQLQPYGVPTTSVKLLRNQAPEVLDYLDLIQMSSETLVTPSCVAESQGQPLLFVVRDNSFEETKYDQLRHALACRGQRVYLARLKPGQLEVIPVESPSDARWKVYYEGSIEALSFFPKLARGWDDYEVDTPDYVFNKMFALLNYVADRILADGLESADVLSLIGRALFFRFLCDREVITEQDTNSIAPNARGLKDCFETAENATATCVWLDQTFNGDFLPLSQGTNFPFFRMIGEKTKDRVFEYLSAIARNYKPMGTGVYQLYFEKWEDFNFAHIPVGLLSQVYEKFTKRWDEHALSTSVHYTPRNIAATMVDEVFDGLPNAHTARVLDPACGAGVFMVLVFRRLYRERWRVTGQRPDTVAIRDILMNQLTGFDISTSALKLAALSLYLTAIELDSEPVPPSKLKFYNLLNKVLFNFRIDDDPPHGPVTGSLNPKVHEFFNGNFDVVISNPPWTPLKPAYSSVAHVLNQVSKEIIGRLSDAETANGYENPDNNPDLPFLWKATEWCKKDGRIAMALHARILLKQTAKPNASRNTLFQLIEVNGIINGSNLSTTAVWHNMEQPFMLLFASNRKPSVGHKVQFITPRYDSQLNRRGEMWIDSESAAPIDLNTSIDEPWLWKTLSVGTSLDVEVMRKLTRSSAVSLVEYWEAVLGLTSSVGYMTKKSQRQFDASHLKGLPNLTPAAEFRVLVRPRILPIFDRDTLSRPRSRTIYRAPLALLKAAPGLDRKEGRALLSFEDVVFNQSFYGYSAAGHHKGELLARYLHLFAHSQMWVYNALLTSPTFGAERNTVNKEEFDNCRIIPYESLATNEQALVKTLSDRLLEEDSSVFSDIDQFFAGLYGLDELDIEVIRDTLNSALPFKETREQASSAPSRTQYEAYLRRLEAILLPFFKVLNIEPQITFWQPQVRWGLRDLFTAKIPFVVLLISKQGEPLPIVNESLWQQISQIASKNGASRIFLQVDGGLAVAIVNQYRYWTQSRARLCASEVLRRYMHNFER